MVTLHVPYHCFQTDRAVELGNPTATRVVCKLGAGPMSWHQFITATKIALEMDKRLPQDHP